MSRYIEVDKAKDIIWSHTRISADDYRLAVRMMFEKSEDLNELIDFVQAGCCFVDFGCGMHPQPTSECPLHIALKKFGSRCPWITKEEEEMRNGRADADDEKL